MKLHNTMSRSIETLQPISDKTVKLYTCGPTVYDFLHVGNWVAYVRWDTLYRVLQTQGYAVDWVMNITDVGHLVSDDDDGQDKLEKGAQREGKTAWEVADFYIDDFLTGLDKLDISIDKSKLVRATDHIDQQIALIKTLEDKGFTYIIDDGVYMDTSKVKDYGKLARIDIKALKAGARVEFNEQKRNITDFALWKFSPRDSKRDMEWESPWGKGFPGWHVECSAMAMEYLGQTLDIHAGGIDHIPIHHTNEIAQSESATGTEFSKIWLHNNFMNVDGTKISKSLQNGFTLQDIEKHGFDALDLRMLILQSHYRNESNFTWDELKLASQRRKSLQAFADLRWQLVDADSNSAEYNTSFIAEALDNDMNTALALSQLEHIVTKISNSGVAKTDSDQFNALLTYIDAMFGLNLLASTDISEQQKQIITLREQARENKDWQQSDKLRDELLAQNIAVRDTPFGTVWSRV